MRPYLHKVVIAPFDGVTRTTCFVLRPKKRVYYSFVALAMFSEQTVAYANQHSKGTTIPYAAWDNALAEMVLIKPPDELLTKYEMIVRPMLQFIQQNFFRQANLRQTRDLLLPRLISGELDVSQLDIALTNQEV